MKPKQNIIFCSRSELLMRKVIPITDIINAAIIYFIIYKFQMSVPVCGFLHLHSMFQGKTPW